MRKSRSNGRWVRECKVCKLYVDHPELWIEIHNRVIKKKQSRRSVIAWANNRVPEFNKDLEPDSPRRIVPFTESNFQAHFVGKTEGTTGHAQDFYVVKRQMSDGEGNVFSSDVDLALSQDDFLSSQKYMAELNSELMDYQNLSNMVDSLEYVLSKYNRGLKDRIQDDKKINLVEIDTFQKQVTALFKLTQDLTDLRNKSTIAGEAVKLSIEMTIAVFLETLMLIMNDTQAMLVDELGIGSHLPKEITDMVLTRQRDTIKAQVEGILKKVMTEFKIK